MASYDLIMCAIAIMAIVFGAWKGLAWQVAWVTTLTIGSLLAVQLRGDLAEQLSMVGPAGGYLAMAIVFAVVSTMIWLIYRIFVSWIRRKGLATFDRRAGAACGILNGLLLCIVVTVVGLSLSGPSGRSRITASHSGRWITSLLVRSNYYLPGDVQQKMQQLLQPTETQGDEVSS